MALMVDFDVLDAVDNWKNRAVEKAQFGLENGVYNSVDCFFYCAIYFAFGLLMTLLYVDQEVLASLHDMCNLKQ